MRKTIKRAVKGTATLPVYHFDGWAFCLVIFWIGMILFSLIGA